MSIYRLLLQFELSKRVKYFKTKTAAKLITSALFLVVFGFVAAGIYSFFYTGFLYINLQVEPDVRQAITLFIYEMFLLAFAGLIILGAIISGMFSLFRSENNGWLLASPKFRLWPKIVLLKSLTTSIIPTLILFLPALLAYNHAYHTLLIRRLPHESVIPVTYWALFLIILAVTFLLTALNSLTLSALTLIGIIYRGLSRRISGITLSFGRFMTILFFFIVLLGLIVWQDVKSVDLVRVFKAYETSATIDLGTIGSHFAYLPTHYLALFLVEIQTGATYTYELGVLFWLAVLSTFLWMYLSRFHYSLWQALQETYSKKDGDNHILSQNYVFKGNQTTVLFKKEALITTRNLKGLAWFFFLFSIWIIQIGTNKILGKNIIRYDPDVNHKLILLQSIECIIALYFISAFALRFVFPSLSVEKKTAWILKSAPLDFKGVFYGKYLFYLFTFLILGVLMSYVSQFALSLPLENGLYGMTLFLVATIGIVTLALSFGTFLPSTESDDPESITTSMGGLFFTATSLLYGGVATWILYSSLTLKNSLGLLVFSAATLCGVIILVSSSVKKTLVYSS